MKKKRPRILVVGSFMMDLIVSTEQIPQAGETVFGETFATAPGGKGANQAIQAARLGAEVTMVGKVGMDSFGDTLIASMQAAGVHTEHVLRAESIASGVGNIVLLRDGGKTTNNRITVIPGANSALCVAEVRFLEDTIDQYDMVLLQNEIPPLVNQCVADYAHAAGTPVMLNPAPFRPLSAALLSRITYLSPNEHEAADLSGLPLEKEQRVESQTKRLMAALHGLGVKNVLVTLGESGALLSNGEDAVYQPCVPGIDAVDPTAAGDSFVSAFCVGLCMEMQAAQALRFASYTAALTVSALGAQPSLPQLDEVMRLMEKHGEPMPELADFSGDANREETRCL